MAINREGGASNRPGSKPPTKPPAPKPATKITSPLVKLTGANNVPAARPSTTIPKDIKTSTPIWRGQEFKDAVHRIISGNLSKPTTKAPLPPEKQEFRTTQERVQYWQSLTPSYKPSGFERVVGAMLGPLGEKLSYRPGTGLTFGDNTRVSETTYRAKQKQTAPEVAYTLGGNPIYLGESQTDYIMRQALRNAPLVEQIGVGIPYAISKYFGLAMDYRPDQIMEAAITETPKGGAGVIQSAALTVLSGMAWLATYNTGQVDKFTKNVTPMNKYIWANQQIANFLDVAADKVESGDKDAISAALGVVRKYADPDMLRQNAARLRAANEVVTQETKRIQSWVERSWASGMKASGEWHEMRRRVEGKLVQSGQPDVRSEYAEEYFRATKEREEEARVRMEDFHKKSVEAQLSGDIDGAISYKVDEIKARRDTEFDFMGAYSWSYDPEAYDNFLKDVAVVEMQKGSPVTYQEMQRIKELHVNENIEMYGQVVYDPLNVPVVDAMFEGLGLMFKDSFKNVFKNAPEVFKGVKDFIKKIPIIGWPFRDSLGYVSRATGDKTINLLNKFEMGYGAPKAFMEDVGKLANYAQRFNSESSAAGKLRVFEEARRSVDGLSNFTMSEFEHFTGLADSKAIKDSLHPARWADEMERAWLEVEDEMIRAQTPVARQRVMDDIAKGLLTGLDDDAIEKKVVEVSEKMAGEMMQSSQASRMAIGRFGDFVTEAVYAPFKIAEDVNVPADTVSGNLIRTLREFAGKPVNEAVAVKWARDLGEIVKFSGARPAAGSAADALAKALKFGNDVRNIWVNYVLALNPRWVIQNYIDSSYRSIVYGGSVRESVADLWLNLQSQLADELGYVPIEMSQSLSRSGLDFSDRVSTRFLYKGWNPKKGVFSFIGYEKELLGVKRAAEGLPESKIKRVLANVADGWKSIPGGIADYNTSIEFTLRLRMFHREYFKVINALDGEIRNQVLKTVAGKETREIANAIWKASEGNPAKLKALVKDLTGTIKAGKQSWSFLVPPDIEKTIVGMDGSGQSLFIGPIKQQLREIVETAAESGRAPSVNEFRSFFADMRTQLQDEIQEIIGNSRPVRQIHGTINPDASKQTAHMPGIDELQGSAPKPTRAFEERVKAAEEAIPTLNARQTRVKPEKTLRAFSDAVSPYANVDIKPGAGIFVDKDEAGQVIVTIGEDMLKEKPANMYRIMNDAIIETFAKYDEDFIKAAGWNSTDEYITSMRTFMSDPTAALNANRDKFGAIVYQLENDPFYANLLRRTTREDTLKYQSAVDNYLLYADVKDEMASDVLKLRDELRAQELRALPPEYRIASNKAKIGFGKLKQTLFESPVYTEEMASDVLELHRSLTAARNSFHQFASMHFPGPLHTKLGGKRHSLWNAYYEILTDAFNKEANLYKELFDAATGTEIEKEFVGRIADIQTNPTEAYLRAIGADITWADPEHTIVESMTMYKKGRKFTLGRIMPDGTQDHMARTIQSYFFDATRMDALKEQVIEKITKSGDMTLNEQLVQAFRSAFPMNRTDAEKWAGVIQKDVENFIERTGGTANDYLDMMHVLEDDNLGRYAVTSPDGFLGTMGGSADDAGRISLYGFHATDIRSLANESMPALLNDLDIAARINPEDARESYAAIFAYLERKGIKPEVGKGITKDVTKTVLPDEQRVLERRLFDSKTPADEIPKIKERLQEIGRILYPTTSGAEPRFQLSKRSTKELSKAFNQYLQTGNAPDIILQRPFFEMKKRLVTIYKDMEGSPLIDRMAPEVKELMEKIRGSVSDAWNIAEDRKAKLMREFAGLPQSQTEDALWRTYMDETGAKTLEPFINSTTDPARIYRGLKESEFLTTKEKTQLVDKLIEVNDITNREIIDKYIKTLLGGEASKTFKLSDTQQVRLTELKKEIDDLVKSAERRSTQYAWASPADRERLAKLIKKKMNLPQEAIDALSNRELAKMAWSLDEAAITDAKSRLGVMRGIFDSQRATLRDLPTEVRHDISSGLLREYTDIDINTLQAMTDKEVQDALDKLMGSIRTEDSMTLLSKLRGIPAVDEVLSRASAGRALRKAGDVPIGFADLLSEEKELLLSRVSGNAPSVKVSEEIGAAWDAWKLTEIPTGMFPEDALKSPDALRSYLKDGVRSMWDESSQAYEHWINKVNDFEDTIMNLFSDKYRDYVAPVMPEVRIPEGVKTWMTQRDYLLSNYDQMLRALDQWEDYMVKATQKGGTNLWTVTSEQAKELIGFADVAAPAKADLVSRAVADATKKTNDVMLDYEKTSNFDNLMRNFFPFWKFPSRSLPFWVKTMAMHPEVIMLYEKLQQYSRTQLRQAGAVTSRGEILPSMDGYTRIPGTQLWFNPTAPLSFRYVLDVMHKLSPYTLSTTQGKQELDPMAFLFQEITENSRVYGFSPAPWITWGAVTFLGVPKEIAPPWPIVPQISLFPRYAIPELFHIGRNLEMGEAGVNFRDMVYPKFSGYDWAIENKILADALDRVQNARTPTEAMKYAREAEYALRQGKNSELWKSTELELNNSDWARNLVSFFTGVYAKPFTEDQAALVELNIKNKMLKSSMNNLLQRQLFEIPEDPHEAWDYYIKKAQTPEAFIHELRSDISFLTDNNGLLVSDPNDRAILRAQAIESRRSQQAYYDKVSEIWKEFEERQQAHPIGAKWEEREADYDWLDEQLTAARDSYTPTYQRSFGTYKPIQLIQEEIAKGYVRFVAQTRPRWNIEAGEKYNDYEVRVKEWEDGVRTHYSNPRFLQSFQNSRAMQDILSSLHSDQQIGQDFFNQLGENLKANGIESLRMTYTDSIFTAMNRAYDATYKTPYYDAIINEDGTWKNSFERMLAEMDFAETHQIPDGNSLWNWINAQPEYQGRFTKEDVLRWTDESGVYSIGEALDAVATEEENKRDKIWEYTAYGGPGKGYTALREAFVNQAADMGLEDIDGGTFDAWFESAGNLFLGNDDKLSQMLNVMEGAVRRASLNPPTDRAEIEAMSKAQSQNDVFKDLVKEQLGPNFFIEMSRYYELPYSSQKEYKKQNPQMYKMITGKDYVSGTYNNLKKVFAGHYPEWAKYYYGKEVKGTVAPIPAAPATPVNTPVVSPQATSVNPRAQNLNTVNIPQRGGQEIINYPSGMTDTIGNNLRSEIDALFTSNDPLSPYAVDFLHGLSIRHPEWGGFIQAVFAQNAKATGK